MAEAVRNQRDTVFRALYKDPKNALELYNGLGGRHYKDETQLRYNTLENAVYLNIKNDVSFIVQDSTNLYEQQSTWNPNMPLRNLFYISDIMHSYQQNESRKTLYGGDMIMLPNPEFVVFYNGSGEYPEYSELKLSDSFVGLQGEPSLELRTKVYNINSGMNMELKERCPTLAGYVTYTELVAKYRKTMPLKEAVEKAVNQCIDNNVLRDFLLRQKSEVVKMGIYECDMEWEMERLKKQIAEKATEEGLARGMAQGMAQGMERGLARGMAQGRSRGEAECLVSLVERHCADGKSEEEACEVLKISMTEYHEAKKLLAEAESI